MKELAAKEKAEARAQRREQRVHLAFQIELKAREEAIARGEVVPDMETMDAEPDSADASSGPHLHLNDDGLLLTDVGLVVPFHAVNQQQRRRSRSGRRARRHGSSSSSSSPSQNSRCFSVEKAIAEEFPAVRILLLLTKIDCLPREALHALLDTIPHEIPAILWKNSTMKPTKRSRKPGRLLGIRKFPRDGLSARFVYGPDALMEVAVSPRFDVVSAKLPKIPRFLDQCVGDRVLRGGSPRSAACDSAEFPAVSCRSGNNRGGFGIASDRRFDSTFHGSRYSLATTAGISVLRLSV